jgi:hypothetical protein
MDLTCASLLVAYAESFSPLYALSPGTTFPSIPYHQDSEASKGNVLTQGSESKA